MHTVYNIEYQTYHNNWIGVRMNYPTFEQALAVARRSPFKTFRIIQTAIEEGEVYREVRN